MDLPEASTAISGGERRELIYYLAMSRATFRIEELHIRSFRGIDELHLTLPGEEDDRGALAILAGDNGCGKTAVLEAILLVLGKLELLPEDAAPLEEQVQFGAPDFRIEAVVRVAKEPERRLVADTKTLLRAPRPVPGLNGSLEVTPMGPFWTLVDGLKPSVEYFSSRREPEALGEAATPTAVASAREARRVAELKRRLSLSYFHSLRAGQGKMPEGSPFARLQAFVRRFLGEGHTLDILPISNNPGAEFDVIVRKGEIPADITSLAMARAAAIDRKDIPQIIPIDRLSSGQVALFAFAGPLVFRDAPADVVLIDEPEQHMHVQWQRYIVDALRELSPESQFVVATHSIDVLDSALSYERILLAREDDPRTRLSLADAAAE